MGVGKSLKKLFTGGGSSKSKTSAPPQEEVVPASNAQELAVAAETATPEASATPVLDAAVAASSGPAPVAWADGLAGSYHQVQDRSAGLAALGRREVNTGVSPDPSQWREQNPRMPDGDVRRVRDTELTIGGGERTKTAMLDRMPEVQRAVLEQRLQTDPRAALMDTSTAEGIAAFAARFMPDLAETASGPAEPGSLLRPGRRPQAT